MIDNIQEYEETKKKLEELKESLVKFSKKPEGLMKDLYVNGLHSLIEELTEEIEEYERTINRIST